MLIFYDAPTPPPGIFDTFLAIPYLKKDISTRSYLSLVQSTPDVLAGTRYALQPFFHCSFAVLTTSQQYMQWGFAYLAYPFTSGCRCERIYCTYSKNFAIILTNTSQQFWGGKLGSKSFTTVSYAIEPFLPSIYSHNQDSTAFPPVRSLGFLPNNILYSWTNETFDEDFHEAARSSAKSLFDIAQSDGQSLQGVPLYPNYAIYGTSLKDMYGSNLPKLQSLQAEVDPHNVMALAGGWKF